MNAYTLEDEAQDDEEIAERLVRDGWKSTSNKNRTIARLPKNRTGLEALSECAPNELRRIMEHAEQRAADVYRRMYATVADKTKQELDFEMFRAFKHAGGESSF